MLIFIFLLLIIVTMLYRSQYEYFEYTPDMLYEHLTNVSKILKTNNIKHWIMYGTLLGAIREQNIISYDYDFDLGANIDDLNSILNLNDDKSDYKFVKSSGMAIDIDDSSNDISTWRVSVKIYYKDIEVGDIYLYQKCSDGYMRRFDKDLGLYFWPNSTFPSWFIDKLDYVKIRDNIFPAPRLGEELLLHWYGKTWKTPIKAKAQGGSGDENSDYYGGSLNINLKVLRNNLHERGIIIEKPIYFKSNKIKYIMPFDQKKWILENE